MAGGRDIRAGRAFIELALKGRAQVEAALTKIAGKFRSFGSAAASIGGILGGGALGLGALFLPMVTSAADAREAMAKFSAVFGDQAEKAGKFVDELASKLGRSATDIRQSMSAFQAFFVGLDFAPEEATQMSQAIQKLALDFAAFHNISDEDAMARFISALSGSSEVLDQFGVNIKQAAIDQKLLEMGLPSVAKGATEAQKAMARLAIIAESLGAQGALGAAERESGSFTNRMKQLKAAVQDLKRALGEALIEPLSKFLNLAVGLIKPITEWAKANQKIVATVAAVVVGVGVLGGILLAVGAACGAVAFAISGLVSAIGVISSAFAFLVSPVGLAIAAVVGIGAALFYLLDLGPKIKSALSGLFAEFGASWNAIVAAVKSGDLSTAWAIVWKQAQVTLMESTMGIVKTWLAVKEGMSQIWDDLITGIMQKWRSAINFIADKMLSIPGAELVFGEGAREALREDFDRETEERERQAGKRRQDRTRRTDTALEDRLAALEKAKRELEELQNKALDGSGIVKPKGAAKIQTAQSASSSIQSGVQGAITSLQRGTFSARFAQQRLGLGAVGPQERTAKATEKTAAGVGKVIDELKNLGLEFG